MIINKVTVGFVVQTFDTETGKCIGQDFVGGDDVTYETQDGEGLVDFEGELEFPLTMVQPVEVID